MKLHEYIARNLLRPRAKFSTLHSEWEQIRNEEIKSMATPTSSNSLNASASGPVRIQIGRQPNVTDQGRTAEAPSADRTVSGPVTHNGMGVDTQVIVGEIKPVDRRTIEGSYNGKTVGYDRESSPGVGPQFSTDFAKNSPAPREGMTQAKMCSSKLDFPKPEVTVTDQTEPTSEVE
jgi:hypothetical protein